MAHVVQITDCSVDNLTPTDTTPDIEVSATFRNTDALFGVSFFWAVFVDGTLEVSYGEVIDPSETISRTNTFSPFEELPVNTDIPVSIEIQSETPL